jgi:hypothetical protein
MYYGAPLAELEAKYLELGAAYIKLISNIQKENDLLKKAAFAINASVTLNQLIAVQSQVINAKNNEVQ